MSYLYDVDYEPLVTSKLLFDTLYSEENPADLIALYMHYYYVAKWQHTNTARSTTNYTAKKLNWSERRVRQTKQVLIRLGLIEDKISHKNTGKFGKSYIYVRFMYSDSKVQEAKKIASENESHALAVSRRPSNRDTYALSNNNKEYALSNNTHTLKISSRTKPITSKKPKEIVTSKQNIISEENQKVITSLEKIVRKHSKVSLHPNHVTNWNKSINKLFKVWKGTHQELLEMLKCYYLHFDSSNKFHTVIYSADALCEKIDKLESFCNRVKNVDGNRKNVNTSEYKETKQSTSKTVHDHFDDTNYVDDDDPCDIIPGLKRRK